MIDAQGLNMKNNNPWDDLSAHFQIPDKGTDMSGEVADNVLIAWPVILEFLGSNLSQKSARILDLGCGTGGFTSKLLSLGYRAIGIDPSSSMIRVGNEYFGSSVELHEGDVTSISKLGVFDAIVAMMSLQFVQDLRDTLSKLEEGLVPRGLLIFAVFNPEYVTDCIRKGVLFSEFDSVTKPNQGMLELNKSIKIPTYIRTAREYHELLQEFGFECLLESYPPFTKDFIQKYPDAGPYTSPEYMIFGCRKMSS